MKIAVCDAIVFQHYNGRHNPILSAFTAIPQWQAQKSRSRPYVISQFPSSYYQTA
jgi:hypothetical protein